MTAERKSPTSSNDFDLIVRNSFLDERNCIVDIGIKDGCFQVIASKILAKGKKEIDTNGSLVISPFIDSHSHLDKCFYKPVVNNSGTLKEAIQIMSVSKGDNLLSSFSQRVNRALQLAIKNGTFFIRTHIDVDPINSFKAVELMQQIKEQWQGLIDIQIVAFPQEGVVKSSGTYQSLRTAIGLGAEVIGGIPALEKSKSDQEQHINMVFDLAEEFNLPVDMHIDETDDPMSCTLELLANTTIDRKWQNRVSAAHCCSLSSQDDGYAKDVISLVAEAGISIITNPTTNLVLQGRSDRQPVRRGITRVKEFIEAGVNVACGHDNLSDSFYPFGQGDMIEIAFITALAAHMTGDEEIKTVMNMPRKNASIAVGYSKYGILEGNPANLVITSVRNISDLLSLRPPDRTLVRNGSVICQTTVETKMIDSKVNDIN